MNGDISSGITDMKIVIEKDIELFASKTFSNNSSNVRFMIRIRNQTIVNINGIRNRRNL